MTSIKQAVDHAVEQIMNRANMPRVYAPGGLLLLPLTERGASLKSEFVKHGDLYMTPDAAAADLEIETAALQKGLEMQSGPYSPAQSGLTFAALLKGLEMQSGPYSPAQSGLTFKEYLQGAQSAGQLSVSKMYQKAFYEGTAATSSPPLEEQIETAPVIPMMTCGYYLGYLADAPGQRLDALEL